jgi:hypothetical protein
MLLSAGALPALETFPGTAGSPLLARQTLGLAELG